MCLKCRQFQPFRFISDNTITVKNGDFMFGFCFKLFSKRGRYRNQATGSTVWDSNPGWAKKCSLLQNVTIGSATHSVSYSTATGVLFEG